MRKIKVLLLTLVLFSTELNAQTPAYFSFTDTVVMVGTVREVPPIFYDCTPPFMPLMGFQLVDSVARFMNNNPGVTLELGTNTSYHGTKKNNLALSQSYGDKLEYYIIKRGIREDRIVVKGYGETNLKISRKEMRTIRKGKDQEKFEKVLFLNERITFKILKNDTTIKKPVMKPKDLYQAKRDSFYLYYSFAGLGSNRFNKEPKLVVKQLRFYYTNEQTGFLPAHHKIERDTISSGMLSKAAVDSIILLIKDMKDTCLSRFNPCIMSGGIHYLILSIGADTIEYSMTNTFERTALKIIEIVNPYLPPENKIYATEEYIKNEEDCWENKFLFLREKEVKKNE